MPEVGCNYHCFIARKDATPVVPLAPPNEKGRAEEEREKRGKKKERREGEGRIVERMARLQISQKAQCCVSVGAIQRWQRLREP